MGLPYFVQFILIQNNVFSCKILVSKYHFNQMTNPLVISHQCISPPSLIGLLLNKNKLILLCSKRMLLYNDSLFIRFELTVMASISWAKMWWLYPSRVFAIQPVDGQIYFFYISLEIKHEVCHGAAMMWLPGPSTHQQRSINLRIFSKIELELLIFNVKLKLCRDRTYVAKIFALSSILKAW